MQTLSLTPSLAGLSLAFFCSLAAAAGPCERHMAQAARLHGVPLGVLYAVGMTETGRKGSLHPHAMNIEGEAVYAGSASAAIRRFREAQAGGAKLIDIGCMQINHHFHREKFASLAEMFDPASNVAYAAKFLRSLYRREGSWTLAVARYHTGRRNYLGQKRYVCAVIGNLVASGFGAWTAAASELCRKPRKG